MKQGAFENEVFIRCRAEQAVELLSNYNLHHKLHPLLLNVEQVEAPASVLRRYLVTDQLEWGPFRFRIVYRADVIEVSGNEVVTEAHQSPNVTVRTLTVITPEGNGIRLHETITLRAPNLLFGYAFDQAKAAHEIQVQRLKTVLEA